MQTLNEFVLLKALFVPSLHDAVLSQDEPTILSIIKTKYQYEIQENFFVWEPLDLEWLKREHIAQCNDKEFIHRMLY
jgi:hypothetical protein